MNNSEIYCPGGVTSQSGTAGAIRYPYATIHSSGESIPDIIKILDEIPGPHILPIWNSHQGSIKAAEFIWDRIEDSKLKIYDIWAKAIEFWLVKKKNTSELHNAIGSVVVAESQCSKFLASLGEEIEFVSFKLTTVAFDEYKKGSKLDGVLIAPQEISEIDFVIESKKTANDNNFTTFINFVDEPEFLCVQENYLTAVSINSIEISLSEGEQSLFENLFSDLSVIDDIPKLLIVIKRVARVGLIFEGRKIHSGDLLDAEELSNTDLGINIYEEVGNLATLYSTELKSFFDINFPALLEDDFLVHKGHDTCLFACPALNIYIHGYEISSVEPGGEILHKQIF